MPRFLFKAADSLVQTRPRMIYSCVLGNCGLPDWRICLRIAYTQCNFGIITLIRFFEVATNRGIGRTMSCTKVRGRVRFKWIRHLRELGDD